MKAKDYRKKLTIALMVNAYLVGMLIGLLIAILIYATKGG